MEHFDCKKHWDEIYKNKLLKDVSWYQPIPETSLHYFSALNISKDAEIIDIGGGDSFLVDHLLDLGYKNVTVLDISEAAIQRAKERLGDRASRVSFVVSNITDFVPPQKYDVWHDRAAFHFLTNSDAIQHYVAIAENSVTSGGTLIIGTFSEVGPFKCSGIEITQYSQKALSETFATSFTTIACQNVDHPTPFDTVQNFTFCSLKRK